MTLWPGRSFLVYKCAADHRNRNSEVVGMMKEPHLTVGSAELAVVTHPTAIQGGTAVPTVAV